MYDHKGSFPVLGSLPIIVIPVCILNKMATTPLAIEMYAWVVTVRGGRGRGRGGEGRGYIERGREGEGEKEGALGQSRR